MTKTLISGKVEVGQHVVAVEDGQLMIFIPEGEGGSEPLTQEVVDALRFIAVLAAVALTQEVTHA